MELEVNKKLKEIIWKIDLHILNDLCLCTKRHISNSKFEWHGGK